MIRYDITLDELNRRIDEEKPSWRGRARQRTEDFRRDGAYNESSDIWGEIKAVYMRLQHNKCAYCERKLEGRIEFDLEHFRPKKAIQAYPPLNELQYPFLTGNAWPQGYYLLAYHLQNYLTACKICNSTFKRSYFPIAGTRQQSDDPIQLLSEMPFLIYPIGTIDDDPETLLEFEGVHPKPRYSNGHEYRRVEVIIDMFDLDVRDTLLIGRARVIYALWLALTKYPQDQASQNCVAIVTRASEEHCNCARSFYRLFQQDRTRAEQIADDAIAYWLEYSS